MSRYPLSETLEGPIQPAPPAARPTPQHAELLATWSLLAAAAMPLVLPARPMLPWELLDLGLTPIASAESWQEATAIIRRYPRRTQLLIRHWRPVGGKFHQEDGLWMAWVNLAGVLRTRPIKRHWPIDPA